MKKNEKGRKKVGEKLYQGGREEGGEEKQLQRGEEEERGAGGGGGGGGRSRCWLPSSSQVQLLMSISR